VGYILSFHWYYCYLRTYISLKMIYIYILWVFIKSLYVHVLMGQLFSSLNLLGADGTSGTLYEESGDIPSALQPPISEFMVFLSPHLSDCLACSPSQLSRPWRPHYIYIYVPSLWASKYCLRVEFPRQPPFLIIGDYFHASYLMRTWESTPSSRKRPQT